MSRNILNDVASLPLVEDVGGDEPTISDPLSLDRDQRQSDPADNLISKALQVTEDGSVPQGSVLENETAVTKENQEKVPAVSFIAPVSAGNAVPDAGKPPHADEM